MCFTLLALSRRDPYRLTGVHEPQLVLTEPTLLVQLHRSMSGSQQEGQQGLFLDGTSGGMHLQSTTKANDPNVRHFNAGKDRDEELEGDYDADAHHGEPDASHKHSLL